MMHGTHNAQGLIDSGSFPSMRIGGIGKWNHKVALAHWILRISKMLIENFIW